MQENAHKNCTRVMRFMYVYTNSVSVICNIPSKVEYVIDRVVY